MYVQPAHRGSGIAKQLLDALETICGKCRLRMALPRFRAGHGHRRSLLPAATGFNLALLTTTIPGQHLSSQKDPLILFF